MIYGPCTCGFPAIKKCHCGARLCNNCKDAHECPKVDKQPELIPAQTYQTKPGKYNGRK